MKLYIVGLSGSGKTTLANSLAEKYNLRVFSVDYILWNYGVRSRFDKSKEEINASINSIIKQNNWIVESTRIIPELIENCENIIFLNVPLYKLIYRQWYRFFTNKTQRKEHGFSNNIKLSINITRRTYSKKVLSDPFKYNLITLKYFIRKSKNKIKDYRDL